MKVMLTTMAVLVALPLAGCGGGAGSSTTPSAGGGSPEQSVPSPASSAAQAEGRFASQGPRSAAAGSRTPDAGAPKAQASPAAIGTSQDRDDRGGSAVQRLLRQVRSGQDAQGGSRGVVQGVLSKIKREKANSTRGSDEPAVVDQILRQMREEGQ